MTRKIILLIFSVMLAGIVGAQIQYLPRAEYGRRLEPKGKILTGAGQASRTSFEEYVTVVDSVSYPDIYMDYFGLEDISEEKVMKRMAHWKSSKYPVIPQIGLAMTHDGNPEKHYEHKVANGLMDSSIHLFANTLARYPGNIMIRLGYEFNGHWNGYYPDAFKVAYRRVAGVLRQKLGDRLALVWCMALDGDNHNFTSFYPGDDVVDWWSVDVFGEGHFTHKALKPFLDSAHAHRFPVLIGESSPRRLSVQMGKESVDRWFRPYFDLMAKHPGIKGFSYIYWDWSKTRWADWGDGQFGKNPDTRRFVLSELKKDIFQTGNRHK